ncbi:hypothetical protein GCM10022600_20700 [Qipengyuania pelagi]
MGREIIKGVVGGFALPALPCAPAFPLFPLQGFPFDFAHGFPGGVPGVFATLGELAIKATAIASDASGFLSAISVIAVPLTNHGTIARTALDDGG